VRAVNIRKFVARAHRLDDLVGLGTLTTETAAFLDASVRAGLSILVSGGTQAGKTTMLNCLAAAIPGSERVWCRAKRSSSWTSSTLTVGAAARIPRMSGTLCRSIRSAACASV